MWIKENAPIINEMGPSFGGSTREHSRSGASLRFYCHSYSELKQKKKNEDKKSRMIYQAGITASNAIFRIPCSALLFGTGRISLSLIYICACPFFFLTPEWPKLFIPSVPRCLSPFFWGEGGPFLQVAQLCSGGAIGLPVKEGGGGHSVPRVKRP